MSQDSLVQSSQAQTHTSFVQFKHSNPRHGFKGTSFAAVLPNVATIRSCVNRFLGDAPTSVSIKLSVARLNDTDKNFNKKMGRELASSRLSTVDAEIFEVYATKNGRTTVGTRVEVPFKNEMKKFEVFLSIYKDKPLVKLFDAYEV